MWVDGREQLRVICHGEIFFVHGLHGRDVTFGKRYGDRGNTVGKGSEVDTEVGARGSHRSWARRVVDVLKVERSRSIDKGEGWIMDGRVREHKLGIVDGQMGIARAVKTQ